MIELVDAFNKVREDVIVPGKNLVVDECMSAWRGLESKYRHDGCPSLIKIKRKPEGVGSEFKSLAEGEIGCLLRLDPREELHIQRGKQYEDLGSGTGAPLRLVRPYFNTGRVLTGDSAFGSLKLVRKLREHGLYFQGIVKQAHTGYPKKHFNAWSAYQREKGSSITLVHEESELDCPVYATRWIDKRAKDVISNFTRGGPGNPCQKKRHRVVEIDGKETTEKFFKEVPRPLIVENVFKCFSVIDVHDHLRQGSLAMEKSWVTQKWSHRIFATLLGMTVVDAFLLYTYEYKCDTHTNRKELEFREFLQKLVFEMVNNIYYPKDGAHTRCQDDDDSGVNSCLVGLFIFIIIFAFQFLTSFSAFDRRRGNTIYQSV